MKTFNLQFSDRDVGKETSSFMLDRISPSMLGTYLQCPLAFYYGSILKVQIPQENLHLLFGTAVHKAIEEMYNGNPDMEGVFAQTFNYNALDPKSQQQHSQYTLLGLDMVKNYQILQPKLDSIYHLSKGNSEFRFKKPIINPVTGEASRIPLSGVVDRVLTDKAKGRIVEYKTSKDLWSSKETRFKTQSRLYNLWMYTEFGYISDETIYIVLLKKFKATAYDKTVQVIRYRPTKEDLAEAWEELDTVLDKIEAGMFERPLSGHPRYCDCFKYERALGLKA